MPITFGGLSTGLDTESIISQLVDIEKQPATLLQKQQSTARTRSTLYGNVISRLQSITTAAGALDSKAELRAVTASSGDTSRVKVTSSSLAQPGSHRVIVKQLAAPQTARSATFATNDAGVAGAGTVSLTVGTGTPVNISYDGTDTLESIASKINGAGQPVSASVLYDGSQYRLILQSTSPGSANAVAMTDTGALQLGTPGSVIVPATDAIINLDGTDVTRPTNVISDALTGVTLTLTGKTPTGEAGTSVDIAQDPAGVRTKVQSFVDAYNTVVQYANDQLNYTGTQKGQDTLFGDPGLQRLQRQLSTLALDSYGDGTTSKTLKDFGVSLDRTGRMSIDASKFEAALSADPSSVEKLFLGKADNASGLSFAFTSMVKQYTNSTDGIFTQAQKSITTQISSWDKQITRINDSASKLETRLRLQFSRMEQASSAFQSQLTYLSKLGSE